MSTASRILTVGETMVLFDALDDGPARAGSRWQLRVAGAESNVAIALTRLGVPATWVSRLGTDEMGDVVVGVLAREGLDLRFVVRDATAPTGTFLKWRCGGRSHVTYYRRGSAATHLDPRDVPDEALKGVSLVHLTGITMALGDSPREAVLDLARRAKALGAMVMFDPNYRPALWAGPQEAAASQQEALRFVDWYLCGLEEGQLLFGVPDAEGLLLAIRTAGSGGAVVRIGTEGALVCADGGIERVAPSHIEEVVDEVGAGDGFDAGFAFGLLRGWSPAASAHAGNIIAASALRGTGDWETYPHLNGIWDQLGPVADT
jgi:2-dehydro-3-deoxygluconokinase